MTRFQGTYTALVTPFIGEAIDLKSLDRLLKQQLDAGIDGFVVNGTTAESPTLTAVEVEALFKHIRSFVGDKVKLIVGTGSNSTHKTVEDSKRAEQIGADGLLLVVPYYNKPPQRGLCAHFKSAAEAVKIPTLLYNVPGRTVATLSVESIAELSKVSNIVGIKEASGQIDFAKQIIAAVGSQFTMLSGDDGTYVEFLNAGGHGVISVATHIIPKQMVQWKMWVKENQIEKARSDIKKHEPLINLLFAEANPIPVKKALQLMGILDSASLRLPLVELTPDLTEKIKIEMKNLGLL